MSQSDIYVKDPIKNVQRVQNMLLISQKTDALLQLLGPNKINYSEKKQVLKSVIKIIQEVLPTALVIPYGSFVSKCYLINSDIDFCCWTPGQNINQSSHIVQAALSKIQDFKKVQLIDADVPVVKCTMNGIGIDVSFSQPSGILTAYFIELVDNIVLKDHLYKRTLILAQNYFLNEMHILGSHNFMLSSYGLRTMVAFVLLNQTDIVSPFQALYVMLSYFKNFDFSNKVITIFGICEVSKFEGNKNAFSVIQSLQQKYLEKSIYKENAQHFIDKINHLISCRMTMDEKTMREKGYLNILNQPETDQTQGQLKNMLNQIKMDQSITQEKKDQKMQNVISEFVQRLNPIDICDDQSFFIKYVNISDPLMPSNNIGKSVSVQSMNRMQRCITEGQQQLENLLHMAIIDACDQAPEICSEFDFIFMNTLSMTLQNKYELDFHVCQKNLSDSMYRIIEKIFGMPINGLVYQLESDEEEQISESSILE